MLPTLVRSAKGYTRSTRLADPLKTAQRHVLATGEEFFIRPPPSSVPVDVPFANPEQAKHVVEGLSHPLAGGYQAGSSTASSIANSAPRLHRRKQPMKLSEDAIADLRHARSKGLSQTELAGKFGVSRMQAAKYSFSGDSEGRKERRAVQMKRQEEMDQMKANWAWNKWFVLQLMHHENRQFDLVSG